ncbi:MAG: hypothetical protein ACLSE4_13755 [Clostridium sp.]
MQVLPSSRRQMVLHRRRSWQRYIVRRIHSREPAQPKSAARPQAPERFCSGAAGSCRTQQPQAGKTGTVNGENRQGGFRQR